MEEEKGDIQKVVRDVVDGLALKGGLDQDGNAGLSEEVGTLIAETLKALPRAYSPSQYREACEKIEATIVVFCVAKCPESVIVGTS